MSSIPRAGITPRAKFLLPFFLLVLMLMSYLRIWQGEQSGEGPHTLQGRTMGTTFKVVLAQAILPPAERKQLRAALQTELDRLEALMSTYKADSELMRFNAADVSEAVVSADTLLVTAAGQQIADETKGAFDITVRPLVALWGFGAGAKASAPQEAALTAARQLVGHEFLELDKAARKLHKKKRGLEIDLSAIAKGYAVDQLTRLLQARGFAHSLVEVGGEIRVSGTKPDGAWRLGIERPDQDARTTHKVIQLQDMAMATSGDYRNYYERDGVRISHTIDPRTGQSVRHTLASVTVLHPSAMMADGYATALSVMGPAAALEFAKRTKLAAFLITREADGSFVTHKSERFTALTSAAP